MIALTSTNQIIELNTSAASDIDVVVSFVDHTSTGGTLGTQDTLITTATDTTILSAPAASTQRQVKVISISNTSATSNTITVKKDIGGTKYTIITTVLLQDQRLEYTDSLGWDVARVNADWNAVSGDALILNKPSIPTQYTDELAQDAVGNILTNTTSIDAIYNDAGNTISFQREALTGAITATKNSNTTALGSFTLANLNTAVSDADIARVDNTNTFTGIQTFSSAPNLTAGISPSMLPNGLTNINTAEQSVTVVSGTNYYITNSNITLPNPLRGGMSVGSRIVWRVHMSKTAAGTGTFQMSIYRGTTATTSDTRDVLQTLGTQTAVVDHMFIDVTLVVTTVGASGAYFWSMCPQQAAATATGFGIATGTTALFSGTVSSVALNTAGLAFGLGFVATTGTPTIRIVQVQAYAHNLS